MLSAFNKTVIVLCWDNFKAIRLQCLLKLQTTNISQIGQTQFFLPAYEKERCKNFERVV